MSVPARISIVTLGVDDLQVEGVLRGARMEGARGWRGTRSAGSRRPTPTSACSAVKTSRRTRPPIRAEGGLRWDCCDSPRERSRGGCGVRRGRRRGRADPKPAVHADWGGYSGYGGPRWPSVGDRVQPELPDRRRRAHHDLLTVLSGRGATRRCRARTAPRPDRARGSARSTSAPRSPRRSLRRGALREVCPREVRRAVHRLAGEHDATLPGVHHQRLMPRGVAGRRDDPDPVDHVGLAAVQLVRRAFEVVELGDRVVLDRARRRTRSAGRRSASREPRVVAAVVDVEVAVHDRADVADRGAGRREPRVQRASDRSVEVLGLLVSLRDPGVQQHGPVGVVDQIGADDDLSPARGSRRPGAKCPSRIGWMSERSITISGL